MKRLFLMCAMTLILLGSLSESVNSLDRPWSEDVPGEISGPTGDHPWGGDNATGGGTPASRTRIVPTTGISSVDLVLRVYFFRNISRLAVGRAGHVVETTQPQVTTEVGSSTSTNSGSTVTANQ
jgi:hypothetical protein